MIPPSLVEAIARAYLEELETGRPGPQRPPTVEEVAGSIWWNNLSDRERERWLQAAKTGTPRVAWLYARSRWR